ncbi:helix-turn-helix domain-containing protein [Leuconostoc citreum]|uniref:helix-turn-helix domain-containing protein n=1 Tax=Leuconostoc citreum TaxID=33964 RepID=UPI0032DF9C04
MQKTRISLLRKSKGFTQEKLAEKSNLSIRTIQRLESGEDSSLETLRLVANALDVPVTALFETVNDETKEREIELFSEEQTIQITKRRSEKQLLNIKRLIIFISLLLLAFFINKFPNNIQGVLGILWVGLFFLSAYIMKHMKLNWILKMNEKYPLTRDIKIEKPNNVDAFLWWKQPVARNVLMIFWSAIIPLIFILKYALHIF